MGQFLAGLTVFCALAAGFGVYYAQVYAFYEEITADAVLLTPLDGGERVALAVTDFRGIDRDSSPIAYRACFATTETPAALAGRFEPYEGAEPRTPPSWFTCFDAQALGAEIASGTARVFVGERNMEFGIDRVVAITDDGRGYVWHEVNDCGDKAYDGTPLGTDCPARD